MIAQSLIDSSYLARYVLLNAVGITDYKIFPARAIQNSPPTFYFPEPANEDLVQSDLLDVVSDGRYPDEKLDHFLEKNGTTTFIIIKDDKLILENYYNGYDHAAICTSFSTVKSFVSALIGIAIHEGLIGRLDDSIFHYLPELIAPH